jgi:T-complex protein 1 subunit eta
VRQIGGERFKFFEDCPEAKTYTLVLHGGAERFIAEAERSLHDAIMIVKRAIKNNTVVAGGGACEMEVSAYLHRYADKNVPHKQQAIIKSFAKASLTFLIIHILFIRYSVRHILVTTRMC